MSQKKLYKYDRDESLLYLLSSDSKFFEGEVELTEEEAEMLQFIERSYFSAQEWLALKIEDANKKLPYKHH